VDSVQVEIAGYARRTSEEIRVKFSHAFYEGTEPWSRILHRNELRRACASVANFWRRAVLSTFVKTHYNLP